MPVSGGVALIGSRGVIRALLCAIPAVLLAWVGFADAAAAIAWRASPDAALMLRPGYPPALTRKAEVLLADGNRSDVAQAEMLVRRSLADLPLQRPALRVLGTAAELRGDAAGAKRQLLLNNRLSRRDLLTQLWMIEHNVGRGDVFGALREYDITLRIKPDSEQILFPILAQAMTDTSIRKAFLPYLAGSSTWVGPFLSYAAARGPAPTALVTLLDTAGPAVTRRFTQLPSQLLARLLPKGDFGNAVRFARLLPAYQAGLERNVSLSSATLNPALYPLTWTSQEQPGVFARPDVKRATIRIYADTGSAGEVLQRYLALPAGRYVMRTTRQITSAGASASSSWSIKCLKDNDFLPLGLGKNAGAGDQPNGRDTLEIPADCPVQYVSLVVNAGVDVPLDYDLTAITVARIS